MAVAIGQLSFRSPSSNPNPSFSSSSRAPTLPGFRLRPAVCSLKVAGGAVRRNPIGCRLNRSGDAAWLNPTGSNFRPMLPPPRCDYNTGSVYGETDDQKWVVSMEQPGGEGLSRMQMIQWYIQTLVKVLGSDEEVQKKVYNVAFDWDFGFSCHVDEETALKLEGLPGIISGIPPYTYNDAENKDYGAEQYVNGEIAPGCDFKHWLIVIRKPRGEGFTKQQMVDCYVETLAKVLGSEEEAKKKIYTVHFKRSFGFGCEIDEETADKLEGLPGVLDVIPDSYDVVEDKDYGGELFVNGEIVQRSPEKQRRVDDYLEELDRRRRRRVDGYLEELDRQRRVDDYLEELDRQRRVDSDYLEELGRQRRVDDYLDELDGF